jgi:hypothetical protein
MKGQQQGIRSTKQKALDHLEESEKLVKIIVEPGTEEVLPAKRHNDIFFRIEDLAESIHSNQTGAFPYTLQRRHDRNPSGCKLHFLQVNEEQIKG